MTFPLDIGLYAGGPIGFTGKTVEERDLGGAEYCVVNLAEALARRGHTLTVFTADSLEAYKGQQSVTHKGVTYVPRERAWRSVNHATQWDVFIVSRDYALLSNTTIQSKLNVLWNHDTLADPDTFREHIGRADMVYCLSDYHKAQYLRQLTDPLTKACTLRDDAISVTRNGVDVDLVIHALTHVQYLRRAGRWGTTPLGKYGVPTFVYTSRPERGLFFLLADVWPAILERQPDAQLKVACYDVEAEKLPPHIREQHLQIFAMMRTMPSVDFLGALPRFELFQVVAASHAMLYPSVFNEVSCLSILESQALGTPALTSNRGALPESNWSEQHVLFDWEKVERRDATHIAQCADWITGFMTHYWDEGEQRERQAVQDTVQEMHDWNVIAEEWELDFFRHFEQRSTTRSKRIIQNLIYHSDLLAAKYVLSQYWKVATGNLHMDMLPDECHALRTEVEDYLTYHHIDPEMYAGDAPEDISTCPERMRVALKLIEQKFGHDQPFRLLDIGVGAGRFLYHVLRNFHNCQVMGFDFSLELCVQARRNITDTFPALKDDISFIQHCDVLALDPPSQDRQADVVVAAEWLEHQIELVHAMTVVDSWCKEGGLVIYTTPYGPWEAISFGSQETDDGHEIRSHVSHFEHRDFAEMFKNVEYRLQATAIQHSPLDNSVIGNYVVSYEKRLIATDYETGAPTSSVTFFAPDYDRKLLTTRPYVRVGALFITKDEEDNITRALKSVNRHVDWCLVYDTGSTDKTLELAKDYAHEVVEGYWDNDFGEARNRALAELRKHDIDHILWLDADEQLVNGYRLRHYLQGDLNVYEGAILLQQSVMIDAQMTKDIPVRLFRNKQNYGFLGCVHEQLQNLDDPTGNTDLFPVIILPDVSIVHYGFITEATRRGKARHRNYDLLKKDRELHPERLLGQLLLMRDYLHHVKWSHIEGKQPLRPKDLELLYDIIDKYPLFPEALGLRHVLARQFYQEALEILGRAHMPGPDGTVPIHATVLLGGLRGPLPDEDHRPLLRWFKDTPELRMYIFHETGVLCERLNRTLHIFED